MRNEGAGGRRRAAARLLATPRLWPADARRLHRRRADCAAAAPERGLAEPHRYQMLAWTIALGITFIYSAYTTLATPNFDANLLTLLGISSGTYLGFKFPEQQP